MKNQNNDTFSFAQGRYPWGIIKNRKLNSKFVKCSKGVFQNRTLPISMIVGSNLTEQLNCIRKYDKIIYKLTVEEKWNEKNKYHSFFTVLFNLGRWNSYKHRYCYKKLKKL